MRPRAHYGRAAELPGLTQLFWSNVALHGMFELDLDKRLNYERGVPRPTPRTRPLPRFYPAVRCGPSDLDRRRPASESPVAAGRKMVPAGAGQDAFTCC
jgi:hypothetical protein